LRGKILAVIAGIAVVLGIAVTPAPSATAATASNFNAGDIISDSLFYDASAMTSAQIQAFLDKKIGTCSSNDCINILRTNISSRSARISDSTGNVVCKAFTGGTNLRVSEVIYRAQVACGISAKVILVTLQKEQGLVTSKNPSDYNLNYAMGQACPDTAPCDPAFKGIGVQILAGATQLKTYKAAKFGRQLGTYNIQYSPTSSCGTKSVTIKNYGTAALYNYTPYTPNAAALNNLYGSGNGCSSYGNRNFWRDYTDWFGSTHSSSVASIDTVTHVLGLDTTGELWAYPTSGKSTWLPRVSLGSPWSGVARMVAPGDLDGDGRRDLITVTSAGAATLHRGDGALGYENPVALSVNWSGAVLLTDAGDFDGDGIPDVFTTDAGGALLLWRGTGGAGFRAPKAVGNGWHTINYIVGAGDISGDGLPDLIGRRAADGALILYKGNGRGGWVGSTQIGTGWHTMSRINVPGDLNSDGKPDLLGTDTAGKLWMYPSKGGGKFGARLQVGNGMQTLSIFADPGLKANGVRVLSNGVGDVDSDGYRDIASVASDNQLRLHRGAGNGRILATQAAGVSIPAGARVFSIGDFNGDGTGDLGMIDAGGLLYRLNGNGDGGYAAPVQIGNGWNTLNLVFGGIDFDGDRKMDIIGRDSAGFLKLYRGNGAGGWAETAATQIGNGWNGMTAVFAVGDWDGDRAPDVIARDSAGLLYLCSSNGVGGWKRKVQIGNGWNGFTALFSTGDFDHTGGPDIIAAKPDGSLVLYRGTGKGTWGTVSTIATGLSGHKWVG